MYLLLLDICSKIGAPLTQNNVNYITQKSLHPLRVDIHIFFFFGYFSNIIQNFNGVILFSLVLPVGTIYLHLHKFKLNTILSKQIFNTFVQNLY